MGKRDGIKLLIDGLYDASIGFAANSSPQRTKYLMVAAIKIIKPQDAPRLKIFLKSNHPPAIMIGLDLLKFAGRTNEIPLVLARLKANSFDARAFTASIRLNNSMHAIFLIPKNSDGYHQEREY